MEKVLGLVLFAALSRWGWEAVLRLGKNRAAWMAAEPLVTVALLSSAYALYPKQAPHSFFAFPDQAIPSSLFPGAPHFFLSGTFLAALITAFIAALFGILARHALEAWPLWGSAPWQPFALSPGGATAPHFRLRPGPGPKARANARLITLGFRGYILVDQGLLAQYPPEEWRAILSHEWGHHALGHGRAEFRRNTVQGASLGLFLAGWFYAAWSQALGISWQQHALLAFLMLIGWRQMDILSRSLRHLGSWKREMAADCWAAEAGEGQALMRALRRFAGPEPISDGFIGRLRLGQNQTHPPLGHRLAALQGASSQAPAIQSP